jgi:hypothetical protein
MITISSISPQPPNQSTIRLCKRLPIWAAHGATIGKMQ